MNEYQDDLVSANQTAVYTCQAQTEHKHYKSHYSMIHLFSKVNLSDKLI